MRRRVILVAVAIVVALCLWAVRHVESTIATADGKGGTFSAVYTLAFILLVFQMALCFAERPHAVTPLQQETLDQAYVVVNVPLYNEDPTALMRCLESLFDQTRLPNLIHVVDDGSTVDYADVARRYNALGHRVGVDVRWDRQPNAGKRHAQGLTIANTPRADFYLTVDSDGILDPCALNEGLKPFANPKVQSVAGIVLAVNNRKNLLTRLTDLWFVTGQLIDRSAMSAMGSVLVNSGVLALYRADLLREHLDGYLNETFFGRPVEFSDDSMLTIFALMKGKAVQQPSSFAFTLMPETWSHHRRQYLRWMRGAFIRSWWRFRYLPLNRYAYWAHAMAWTQMLMSTVIFAILFFYVPFISPAAVPMFLIVPLLIGYGQSLRYLGFRRADESFASQFFTYLLSPIASLYAFFVLRVIRWYAMATCLKTGWGTRGTVELTMK